MKIDYVKCGLYDSLYKGKNFSQVVEWIKNDGDSYREYCVHCKEISIFIAEHRRKIPVTGPICGNYTPPPPNYSLNGDFDFGKRLVCAKCKSNIVFYFKVLGDEIHKVGSYPSTADLDIGRLINDCDIPKSRFPKGLAAAIGLKAQNVYIGAYAYLRRVYETLIFETADIANKEGVLPDNFAKLHTDEKIVALKDFLPEIMVENRSAYGILSKGIHELSEEECKDGYDILFNLIVLILEDREERRRKELRRNEITKAVNSLNGKLST